MFQKNDETMKAAEKKREQNNNERKVTSLKSLGRVVKSSKRRKEKAPISDPKHEAKARFDF